MGEALHPADYAQMEPMSVELNAILILMGGTQVGNVLHYAQMEPMSVELNVI